MRCQINWVCLLITEMNRIEIIFGKTQKLVYPSGMCLLNDICYITELHNSSVLAFDIKENKSEPIYQYSKISDGHINKPLGITYSDNFGLLVTDADRNLIWRYHFHDKEWKAMDMQFIDLPDCFSMPGGIACSEDNIYVNDFINKRIVRIDSNNIVSNFFLTDRRYYDCTSRLYVELTQPYGIFIWKRCLYFTDTGNDCIRYIDLDTNLLFSLELESVVCIRKPIALTFDSEGNLFVSEQRKIIGVSSDLKRCLFVLDREKWKIEAGKFGIKKRLKYAGAIVSPRNGELLVADTLGGIVYRLVWK